MGRIGFDLSPFQSECLVNWVCGDWVISLVFAHMKDDGYDGLMFGSESISLRFHTVSYGKVPKELICVETRMWVFVGLLCFLFVYYVCCVTILEGVPLLLVSLLQTCQ